MASFAITAASETPSAAANICQKPNSAEAAPARSPNGERVCQRIDHAHSQKEYACAGKKRQKAPVEQREQQDHAAADTSEREANANRSVETEMRHNLRRDNACAKDDHNRAREEQAELQRRELEAFD